MPPTTTAATDDTHIRVTYKGKAYRIPLTYINEEHPGGPDEILPYAGKDITEAFTQNGHSADAEATLMMFLDGTAPETREALKQEQAKRHAGGAQGRKRIDDVNRWTTQQTVVAMSVAVLTAGVVAAFLWKNAQR